MNMILPHHPNRKNKPEKAIGYWSDDVKPQDFVESWDEAQRNAVVIYLGRGNKTLYRWRGISRCRFCGISNGSQCITDGTYVWPSGFAHYLLEHGVKPDAEFVDHINSNPVRKETVKARARPRRTR
jgi:hypothetical protein